MTRIFGCILQSARQNVLLVKGRLTGKWSFPKGHAHKDEDGLACALRETFEETGYSPRSNYSRTVHLSKGKYFLYNVTSEITASPRDTREVIDHRWVSIYNIPQMDCNVDVNAYYNYFLNISTWDGPAKRELNYLKARTLPCIVQLSHDM